MLGPDPRPSPGAARGAESYEAKCERRQETREGRRCRPNVTTCRPLGRAQRAQHRERLRRARQRQFCRRRNLEEEEEEDGQAREQGSPRRAGRGPGQASVLQEPLARAGRTSFSGHQVSGASSEVSAAKQQPPCSRQGAQADQRASQPGALQPQGSPVKKPHQHRGTQTKAEEAQPAMKSDASQQTNYGVTVLDKEIIQLSEYLNEALQRELVLKQKMVILQDLLSTLIRASDHSWKGQLNEDKLKSKLRSLENRLYTCTQKYPPWGIKKVLLEMEDQKNSYELKAKESLQKVLEEKLSAEQQLHSAQRSLALAEQKCEEWRSQYEALKEDWRTLGAQHRELESQLHVLQAKLQGADSRDAQMNQALRLLEKEHQALRARIEHLQGDGDPCSPETRDLQDRLRRSEEERRTLATRVRQLQDQALPVWNPKPSCKEAEPEDTGEEKDPELRDQLQKTTLQLQAKEKECREVRSRSDDLGAEHLSCLHELQHCREEPSQQPPPRRPCDQWLPILMVVIATALAVFLANKDNLMS